MCLRLPRIQEEVEVPVSTTTPTQRRDEMKKSITHMTEAEIEALPDDEAKEILAEVLSEYQEALNKSVGYVAEKLVAMQAGTVRHLDDDLIIAINTTTNVTCFSLEVNAGALAVAQLELARLQIEAQS
jgi:hypothetical protein